jgi:KTSC domain
MTITETVPVLVDSTLLASVLYDVGELILQLEFCNGAIYRYFAVPAAIHDGLLIADSKGSYFNRKIRSGFRYVRIRRPR